MQFNITKIEIENFRSIQDKVTLNIKSGLFSIEGINYTETNSTNGSGKSTLISALFWALTGSSLTNEVLADEVVNLKTNKNCRVSVYITTDKDEIKITRVRKDTEHGNNLFLEINGQDLSCHKVADTQDRINKLIKIPFDLLKSTIIMTSGMNSAFSSMTPQQRINTLESIRDYSVWERLREEANKDIKDYTNKISENNLQISNLSGRSSTYTQFLGEAESTLIKLENNNNLQYWDDQIKEKEKLIKEYTKQVEEKQKIVDNFDNSVIDSSELLSKMNSITEEVNNLKKENQDKQVVVEKEIRDIEYNNKDLEREKALLEKWFVDDTCPTCGKKLDRTEEEIIQKTSILNKYKSDLEANKIKLESKYREKEALSKNTALEIIIEEKRKEYLELKNSLDNIKQIQEEKQSNYNKLYDDLLAAKSVLINTEVSVGIAEDKKKEYNDKVQECKDKIIKYKDEILEFDNTKKQLENDNIELENKKKLSDFFYKLLGAKGELRPYLLNKDIAYLNSRMQFYIGRFFKNTEVSLLLNGASIDIKIQADGVTKSISSLSGGEKKRVDISIQLALYDLIQTVSQSRFNLLCLDEIESLLDPIGCEQLIEIIEDKAENIETVWWITNHPSVKESIPQKILVKKILGKTEVEEI